jgi:transposase
VVKASSVQLTPPSELPPTPEPPLSPSAQALKWLDSIPGISQRVAEIILAEIGLNMARFPSAAHLASWTGLCPGHNESGGKRRSGRTTKGSRWLRQALVEAAQAAMHTQDTYLSAQGRRLTARLGKKKAVIAVAHSLVVIIYHVLSRGETYKDLGGDYFTQLDHPALQRRALRQLEGLGYKVNLEKVS